MNFKDKKIRLIGLILIVLLLQISFFITSFIAIISFGDYGLYWNIIINLILFVFEIGLLKTHFKNGLNTNETITKKLFNRLIVVLVLNLVARQFFVLYLGFYQWNLDYHSFFIYYTYLSIWIGLTFLSCIGFFYLIPSLLKNSLEFSKNEKKSHIIQIIIRILYSVKLIIIVISILFYLVFYTTIYSEIIMYLFGPPFYVVYSVLFEIFLEICLIIFFSNKEKQ